ncbi:unnamed protein product [Clonostachys solani]|uniref:PRA1 family protein n=1 Tax=Clonostachys solani TaxID=160281 RepID=A0A9P0EHZ7_9HYPO|nr:unnamed protein product [Clonostachys solani]
MASISIPIDSITSRFNFAERLQGFNPSALSTKFGGLRPISEFLDFKRLAKPADFSDAQSRANYNLSHYSSNYLAVFIILSIYALITNLTLLFVIILVVAGRYLIGLLNGQDLVIGNFRATTSQLYTGLFVVAIPLGLFASPIGTALWLVGASGATILGHAIFMEKPIDEAFSGEAV